MLVKFFATYRQIAGCKSCDVEAPQDVLALMGVLSERWPEFRNLILNRDGTDKGDDVIIMVNGRHIEHLDGVATQLTEEDYVAITPLVAGG
ncbi:MAG: MoaD family protein [Eggerthellaceae bacterium]|jgi:molybdopterin synthase sulfur carrier subunit|nr:MoaD family protein [Eggerthellaceae bacterium]